jgi:hypothetical protein
MRIALAALAVVLVGQLGGCRVDCTTAADCGRGERCAADGTCAALPGAAPVGAISPGLYMEVVAVYPVPEGKDVPARAPIIILTTRPTDPATVPAAFALTDARGQAVAGVLDWLVDPPGFLFTPARALDPGGAYNASVGTGVRDGDGNALRAQVAWTFTVAP